MDKTIFFKNLSFKALISIFMIILIFFFVYLAGCSYDKSADIVVYGDIYTAEDTNDNVVEAFAVKDGKYVYVGNKEDVKDYIKQGKTEIIDNTDQGMVMPGATEAHGHYVGVAGLLEKFPGYNKPYEELLPLLKETYNSDSRPEYWLSFGMDFQSFLLNFDESKNYAEEIEKIAPGIPVVFVDNAGHEAVCNVTALKAAGVYENCNIRGGEVKKTTSGVASGFIVDELVMYVVEKAIPLDKLDSKCFDQAVKSGIDKLHSRGYTNYLDAALNFFVDNNFYTSVKNLDESGELTVNMNACYNIRSYNSENYQDKIKYAKKLAERTKSNHFNPFYIKLFADGVVEAGTGWLLQEYPHAVPGKEHGNIVWRQDELDKLVKESNMEGLTVHTHAYGDAACQAVINSYINANKQLGKENNNTLGHVRNITKDDIKRAADNKIGIAANLIWHASSIQQGAEADSQYKLISSTMPDGIYDSGYPMKSLVDAGVSVASSTDAPAAETIEGNIFNVIETSTTGMNIGSNSLVFNPSELLTVKEALKMLTIEGANQLGFSDKCGSIKVGKNADFLILDKNFLNYTGEKLRDIHNTKIKNVYFEGKNVYESN